MFYLETYHEVLSYLKKEQDMRKSKEDWLEVGLKTLARDGLGGLTIQHMAHKLRLTKGSFYHHFDNMADYKRQIIAHWADQTLSTAFNAPEGPAAALAVLDALMAEAYSPATETEVAIRTWAQQNEEIRAYVEKVDAVRRDFVFQVFLSLTGDDIQAGRMADLLLAMLIGSIMILPRYSSQQVSVLYAEFKHLYGL
jgi:AcrR family transcriptional regulator